MNWRAERQRNTLIFMNIWPGTVDTINTQIKSTTPMAKQKYNKGNSECIIFYKREKKILELQMRVIDITSLIKRYEASIVLPWICGSMDSCY